MDNPKYKLFKIFFLFSFILIFTTIIVDNLFFSNTTQKLALKNAINKTKERETVVKNFIEQSKNTLASIRELDLFNDYLDNKTDTTVLENIFKGYSKSQPDFMQLRYIDENGYEKIRVDRDKEQGVSYLVSKGKLQNKSNRYYFKDSLSKPYEKVWFSAIDLNIEHGKVEIPYRPTLRAMYPIKHNGKFRGILIINYFMESFLKKLTNAPFYDMILYDNNGYPLVHYDKNKSWGYYKKPKFNISKEFKDKYELIKSYEIYKTDSFVSKKFDLPIYGGLNLILKLKDSYIKQQQQKSLQEQISTSSLIFIFSLFLSIVIIKLFSKTLFNLKEVNSLNEKLNSASKIAQIGFWEYYPSSDSLIWSKGSSEIFELDKTSSLVTKESFFSFLDTKDIDTIKNQFKSSLEKKQEYFFTHKIITDKKNIKIVEARAKHYFNDDGEHIKSIGSIYDITQNYIQQQELANMNRELEETNDELQTALDRVSEISKSFENEKNKYQKLMNLASDAIIIADFEGNLIEYSKQVLNYLRYSDEEIKGLNVFDWDKELDKKEYKKIIKSFSNTPVSFERVHTRKDGTTYFAHITAVIIKIDGINYVYASLRDVTEQRKFLDRLKEQKEEFETIFNYSKDGIAITDLDSHFLKCNDAYLKMTGFTKEELLSKSCVELTEPKSIEQSKQTLIAAKKYGFVENIEKTCIVKDNKKLTTNMSITLLPDKKRFLVVSKDISSLKLLEEQSKLASMGEMIGNIAHQWRQPLSLITTSASGLEMKSEFDAVTNDEIKEFSRTVIEQANYLSSTIDDFKNFIKGDVNYSLISIKDALLGTVKLSDASIKGNFIKLITNVEDDLQIYGNINELEQAFINILNNAKDALKELSDSEIEKTIFLSTKIIDDNKIQIKFLDNAGGIDETVIKKIFEPYFTTKDQSIGTGLGLSMTDKIIKQRHKGDIQAFNEEFEYEGKKYKGACFLITLSNKKQ